MLTNLLKKLIKGENLNLDECEQALNSMLRSSTPEQISAFLVLMRAKGETADEISAFVHAMRVHQVPINIGMPLCDIVGTGGDGANTANISTTASILAAACGVAILKHGNRAVSSQSGSADVLEVLGVKLDSSPQVIADALAQYGFGFCYAPYFYPVLASLKTVRRSLKIPTLFNFIGPLLNPARAQYMVLGVADKNMMPLMADVLIQLNIKRAMVVHGSGLDELNCLGVCDVIEINNRVLKSYLIDPQDLGLPLCTRKDLLGGDARYNAELLKKVINGNSDHLANTVILNAAAAVYISEKTNTLMEAIFLVKGSIESGAAKQTLEQMIGCSKECSYG